VLGSLLFAGIMGVAGGFFPAVRAARLPLIKALKD
jgi:ABC-type antimicrobial peptide transport system permease subunit